MTAAQTRFTESSGASIAWLEMGSGPPLLLVPTLYPHLQLSFQDDSGQRVLFEALGARSRFITFDWRGSGLSQRDVLDVSPEAHLADIDAVVRAAELERFTLASLGSLGALAVNYAADHPDSVERLLTINAPVAPMDSNVAAVYSALIQRDPVTFRETVADIWMVPPEARAWTIRILAESIGPEMLVAKLRAFEGYSCEDALPRVSQPTLVVHAAHAGSVRAENAQRLAAGIPQAEVLLLDEDSVQLSPESVRQAAPAIDRFLGRHDGDEQSGPELRTILFTDVENSTDLVVQHGDATYRALLAEHERLVREALAEHGGNEIKTIGDSFMCWFSSASSALDAAQAMQRKITDHYGDGLRIRIGIHAGEPIQEADGDLYGTSVVRASRIMGQADGGQILVSQVVTDLVEGKGYLFSDAGEFALKGYERAVHLFDVKWEAR